MVGKVSATRRSKKQPPDNLRTPWGERVVGTISLHVLDDGTTHLAQNGNFTVEKIVWALEQLKLAILTGALEGEEVD